RVVLPDPHVLPLARHGFVSDGVDRAVRVRGDIEDFVVPVRRADVGGGRGQESVAPVPHKDGVAALGGGAQGPGKEEVSHRIKRDSPADIFKGSAVAENVEPLDVAIRAELGYQAL